MEAVCGSLWKNTTNRRMPSHRYSQARRNHQRPRRTHQVAQPGATSSP
ncbi:hypothetical protein PAE2_20 [Pseudomonas phage PAE2]|nr:hypothetical protein PAE2_20 [Pseudomonas phage PAE2]